MTSLDPALVRHFMKHRLPPWIVGKLGGREFEEEAMDFVSRNGCRDSVQIGGGQMGLDQIEAMLEMNAVPRRWSHPRCQVTEMYKTRDRQTSICLPEPHPVHDAIALDEVVTQRSGDMQSDQSEQDPAKSAVQLEKPVATVLVHRENVGQRQSEGADRVAGER